MPITVVEKVSDDRQYHERQKPWGQYHENMWLGDGVGLSNVPLTTHRGMQRARFIMLIGKKYQVGIDRVNAALNELAQHDVQPTENEVVVKPGGPIDTIQGAIDMLVADGHTAANRAVVRVYPRASGWTEDIVLRAGITLVGVSDHFVRLNGKVEFRPGGGVLTENDAEIVGFDIQAGSGKSVITLAGSAPGRLTVRYCHLSKISDTLSVVSVTNAQAYLNLSGVTMEHTQVNGTVMDISAGKVRAFFDSPLDVSDYVVFGGDLTLVVGAGADVQLIGMVSTCSGNDAVTVAAGGTLTLTQCTVANTQGNADVVDITGTGMLTLLRSSLSVSGSGLIVRGVLGSTLHYAHVHIPDGQNSNISTAMAGGIKNLVTSLTQV